MLTTECVALRGCPRGGWRGRVRGRGAPRAKCRARRRAASTGGESLYALESGVPDAHLLLKFAQVEGVDQDALCDAAMELGALSVSFEDARRGGPQEVPIFNEPGQWAAPGARRQLWDAWDVGILVPMDIDVDGFTVALRSALSMSGSFAPAQVESVAQGGWVELVNQTFAPMHVAGNVWVCPAWSKPADVLPSGAVPVVIDPGVAFGTGDHPTTQLCQRWLLGHVHEGDKVLDMGCGSGILAITALAVGGASLAVGVDIDPAAVASSRMNHGLNFEFRGGGRGPGRGDEREWAERFEGMLPGDLEDARRSGRHSDGSFDVVVANILAGPLVELAPLHAAMAKPGTGKVCLSGILAEQLDDVSKVYAQYFNLEAADDAAFESGWARLAGVRKAAK